ncbi:hypothetical protein, partial [Coxiella burnetii]
EKGENDNEYADRGNEKERRGSDDFT